MAAENSLDLVIRITAERRDSAVQALTEARRRHDDADKKLQLLVRYRDEYLASANRGPEAAVTDPVRISNTRAFITKLEAAVRQQKDEVDASFSRVGARAKALQGAEVRLRSLEILRERRDEVARKTESRREQTRSDAFAARSSRQGGGTLELRPA